MYRLAVVMVAIFGTMVADALHIQLGVPYAVSTVRLAVALTALFVVWYLAERTLSIHHITTLRRELFYWATVCATFALGTAAGDLTAYTLPPRLPRVQGSSSRWSSRYPASPTASPV